MYIYRLLFLFTFVFYAIPVQASDVFKVGVVPQFEPRKLASIWLPILKKLSERTGKEFQFVGTKNITDFEQKLAKGAFDFAYMNPYHLLISNKQQGYLPLVRDGGRSLYGILVVQNHSPVKNVTELEGMQVAFPSPNALGASLLMRAELHRKKGLTIDPKYVKTHSNVYLNVIYGAVAAGGGVLGSFNQQSKAVRDQLRILYKTQEMPPHPFAAHPRVSVAMQGNIQQALMDMTTSPSGQALLTKVPFKKLTNASLDDYQAMSSWGLGDYYIAP